MDPKKAEAAREEVLAKWTEGTKQILAAFDEAIARSQDEYQKAVAKAEEEWSARDDATWERLSRERTEYDALHEKLLAEIDKENP